MAAPELPSRFPAQVRNVLRTEVRQGVAFAMAPNVFGGVEFGRVGRQPHQDDPTSRALETPAHSPQEPPHVAEMQPHRALAFARGGHPRQRPEGVEKTTGLGALCGGLFQGLLVGCEEFGASAQRSPLPRLDLGRLALLFPAQGTARLTPHCRTTSACTTPRAHMPALRAAGAQVGQPSPEAVPSAVSCSTKAEGRRVSQPVFHQARPGPLRRSLRIWDGRAGEKSGFPVH